MQKALTSALAISIFASFAAAEPMQMTDKELDAIHAGDEFSFSFQGITLIGKPDGSSVVIQNGVEYPVTTPILSLPDGTLVHIIKNSNDFTAIVTNSANISGSVSVVGGGSNVTTHVGGIVIK